LWSSAARPVGIILALVRDGLARPSTTSVQRPALATRTRQLYKINPPQTLVKFIASNPAESGPLDGRLPNTTSPMLSCRRATKAGNRNNQEGSQPRPP
jgi:hypothetical protein